MKKILHQGPLKSNTQGVILLSPEEAHHLMKVLRADEGEKVQIIDGKGHGAIGAIRRKERQIYIDLESIYEAKDAEHSVPLTLFQSVLKGDAMEWVIEKSVELGIQSIVPIQSAYSVVKMKNKSPGEFLIRWQRIADQALKQCGRHVRLDMHLPIEFNQASQPDFMPNLIQAWGDERLNGSREGLLPWLLKCEKKQKTGIWIGPEGGWSESERQILGNQAQALQLGPLILRAETAAIYTACVAQAVYSSHA